MLDAGRAPERIGGLTVFFDHADASRRYVLAEAPRLVADPDPVISLVLFRGDDNRGALLQLEAVLGPTEEQVAAIQEELLGRGSIPTLARPDWRDGKVQVIGWLGAVELAPVTLCVGAPSLFGDPRVVLSTRIDAQGAALAEAALRGDSLPTGLVFELQTLGLAGPLGIEVEADLQAIHDRLTAEGALTTPYGKARIAKTWEDCERDNLVRLRVLDESGESETQRAEALRRVGQDLVMKMFSPLPPAEAPPLLDDQPVAQIELSFRLTIRREELATASKWSFLERRAVPITHYAGASLVGLLDGGSADRHIEFVDLTGTSTEVMVRIEPELEAVGLAAVEVDLSFVEGTETEETVVLDREHPEARLSFDHGPAAALWYRARSRFDPVLTGARDRETAWSLADGRFVAISPRRLFAGRSLSAVVSRGELDWIDHVELVVDAPGEPPRSFVLTDERRAVDVFFPGAVDGALRVTVHWRGADEEPSYSESPRELTEELLLLESPFDASIRVLVVPRPLSSVVSLAVELVTEHDGVEHRRSLAWDGHELEPQYADLRRLVGAPPTYAYRVVTLHDDGSSQATPWTNSDAPVLVVGSAEPVVVHATELVLLGGGPAKRGSLAIEATLEAADARARALLEGDRDRAELRLVAPENAPAPTLVVREFFAGRELHETRIEAPAQLTVLPLAPAPDAPDPPEP